MYSQPPDASILIPSDSSTDDEPLCLVRQETLSNQHLRRIHRRFSLATLIIPTLGTVIALFLTQYQSWEFGFFELSLLIPGYLLTLSGLEIGFHRLYAHKAFQGNQAVLLWFVICGSMAAEGPPINWAATHRRHHSHSDRPGDPHSPVFNNDTKLNYVNGFWHAHVGWMLNPEVTNSVLYAKDLLRDPMVSWVNRWYLGWVGLGLLMPTLLGWAVTGSWIGAVKGFLWGGLVRIFLVHHATWFTNSCGHIIGSRPYVTGDSSTNNFWLSIPCIGVSWHNNHHAFPNSAVTGLYWWQPDPCAWLLRSLEKLGWVWNLRIPTEQMKQAKRRGILSNE